ncbi:retropepsin-like domain-containing protein [Candidatus Woesearchaeota archaeon]|nr:retropepsin-like domain-containing protein [Candidatus Woesearchaeota archaeon]
MAINFRYKSVPRRNNTDAVSPSIPLTLEGSENSLDCVALLDSGADLSVISREFAELLGLDLSGEQEPTFGIGGEANCVRSTMFVKVSNSHEHYSFHIPVMVILDSFDIDILIGRQGFFDEFKITFDQPKKKIILKKHSS